MRMIVLSALFAFGFGIAGVSTVSAAPVGNGLSTAAGASSLLQDVAVRCRSVRTCRRSYYGRRVCTVRRVCHRVY